MKLIEVTEWVHMDGWCRNRTSKVNPIYIETITFLVHPGDENVYRVTFASGRVRYYQDIIKELEK